MAATRGSAPVRRRRPVRSTASGSSVAMTLGSITGTVIGGVLLGIVPSLVLIPLLVLLLVFSAIKVWNHD
ncbi:hypothetical protein CFN17_15530 [Arthrobacter sp. PM3]|nr:hypothetical protein CFN17_15530 [Arthrobacter sp. PM3]